MFWWTIKIHIIFDFVQNDISAMIFKNINELIKHKKYISLKRMSKL